MKNLGDSEVWYGILPQRDYGREFTAAVDEREVKNVSTDAVLPSQFCSCIINCLFGYRVPYVYL
eukprot:scaffold6007_cov183-Amphora_coffeaeformis.AAC.19